MSVADRILWPVAIALVIGFYCTPLFPLWALWVVAFNIKQRLIR